MIYEQVEPTNQELWKIWKSMEESGEIQLRKSLSYKVRTEDIAWCDIVLSVRSSSSMEWRLARYARKLGKFWMLSLDDDFLSLGASHVHKSRKKAILKILNYTDCLCATNDLLAEKYCGLGGIKRRTPIETPFYDDGFTAPPDAVEQVKVVYYVNDGTKDMFEKYLRPVFPLLAEKYGKKIAVYFLATRPDMSEYAEKMDIHYIPHMPFEEFLKYISETGFHIGVAPLDDKGFSKYKYFNKYVEYTRAGIVGLYSDCHLYRQVIQDGFNGILCDNSSESWMRALSFLIDNPDERIAMARRAQEYARERFQLRNIIETVYRNVPEVLNYKSPDKKVSALRLVGIKTLYWLFRAEGWCETVCFMLRAGELKELFQRARKSLGRK